MRRYSKWIEHEKHDNEAVWKSKDCENFENFVFDAGEDEHQGLDSSMEDVSNVHKIHHVRLCGAVFIQLTGNTCYFVKSQVFWQKTFN